MNISRETCIEVIDQLADWLCQGEISLEEFFTGTSNLERILKTNGRILECVDYSIMVQ
jgi:hypothetical protein